MKRTTLPRMSASSAFGHLPYIVATARPLLNGIPSQSPPTASPSEEAARVAQQTAAEVLSKHPTFAARISVAEFAEIIGLALRDTVDQFKRTAGERGPEWMLRYGCPEWCVTDHTRENDPSWHQGPTIGFDAPTHQAAPDETPEVAVAARINRVTSDAEVFGIKTEVWLDLGDDTYEMDLAETDRFIDRMERFLPRLRVLRDQLAEYTVDDRPADPDAVARWRVETNERIARNNAEASE